MTKTIRSPLCDADAKDNPARVCPIDRMGDALGELEAMAWLIDNQMAARLIGAARLSLREA